MDIYWKIYMNTDLRNFRFTKATLLVSQTCQVLIYSIVHILFLHFLLTQFRSCKLRRAE